MKMSRSDLKSLVKECLIELLSEGLGAVAPKAVRPLMSSMHSQMHENKRQAPKRNSLLDQPAIPSRALRDAVRESSGGNPILADILADTAATTLPTFLKDGRGAGMHAPAGSAEAIVAQAAPEQLFGEEASGHWANLAFNTPRPVMPTMPPNAS